MGIYIDFLGLIIAVSFEDETSPRGGVVVVLTRGYG